MSRPDLGHGLHEVARVRLSCSVSTRRPPPPTEDRPQAQARSRNQNLWVALLEPELVVVRVVPEELRSPRHHPRLSPSSPCLGARPPRDLGRPWPPAASSSSTDSSSRAGVFSPPAPPRPPGPGQARPGRGPAPARRLLRLRRDASGSVVLKLLAPESSTGVPRRPGRLDSASGSASSASPCGGASRSARPPARPGSLERLALDRRLAGLREVQGRPGAGAEASSSRLLQLRLARRPGGSRFRSRCSRMAFVEDSHPSRTRGKTTDAHAQRRGRSRPGLALSRFASGGVVRGLEQLARPAASKRRVPMLA